MGLREAQVGKTALVNGRYVRPEGESKVPPGNGRPPRNFLIANNGNTGQPITTRLLSGSYLDGGKGHQVAWAPVFQYKILCCVSALY